jgi:hypothetical protein
VRFGIINLPPSVKRGKMAELGEEEIKMILDWVGLPTQVIEKQAQTNSRPVRGKESEKKQSSNDFGAKEISAPIAKKTAGRRGQADMSRARTHRKIKTGAKT